VRGLRDYKIPDRRWSDGWNGSHGLEPTIDLYVQHEVEVMRAIRRVLRDDGVVFWNLGDGYMSGGGASRHFGYNDPKWSKARCGDHVEPTAFPQVGLKPLDKCGVPERVALALQADGWYWRDTIIWAKGESFNPDRSGSVMPESQKGKRWERHKVKVGKVKANFRSNRYVEQGEAPDNSAHQGKGGNTVSKWQDCPGCPKCEKTGGFILRHGNWRPTKSYEVVLMLTKTNKAWTDGEGVREATLEPERSGIKENRLMQKGGDGKSFAGWNYNERVYNPSGRNLRNVWSINPEPFKGAHFATFPSKLVATCVKIATCERGACPTCGKQWARVMENKVPVMGVDLPKSVRRKNQGASSADNPTSAITVSGGDKWVEWKKEHPTQTLGYMPTCSCYPKPDDWAKWKEHYDAQETIPAVVFDPFMGSGVTALTARRLGRNYIGTEISPEYVEICNHRLEQETML